MCILVSWQDIDADADAVAQQDRPLVLEQSAEQ
jgi:hypothetical protein